jgi:uncharacterized membrane protein SpoIIM required for sporulation
MKRKDWIFFIVSICCWLLPFTLRVFFVEMPEITTKQLEQLPAERQQGAAQEVIRMLSAGNKYDAFLAIFKNNLKGCIINIAGGVLLGLGTLFNLIFNGFFSADIFASSYKSGLSIESILNATLPHGFELVGFWLSGAIGFYIAWNIILFMKGKESFTVCFYKHVGFYSLAIFFIILAAAYVEAYISTSFISQ